MKYRNLRAEMARAGDNNSDFGEIIGASPESVKKKLAGTTDFKLKEMKRAKKRYGGTLDYLFGEDGEP